MVVGTLAAIGLTAWQLCNAASDSVDTWLARVRRWLQEYRRKRRERRAFRR